MHPSIPAPGVQERRRPGNAQCSMGGWRGGHRADPGVILSEFAPQPLRLLAVTLGKSPFLTQSLSVITCELGMLVEPVTQSYCEG